MLNDGGRAEDKDCSTEDKDCSTEDKNCSTWKYWNLLLQQAEVPGTGSKAWTMYENAKV